MFSVFFLQLTSTAIRFLFIYYLWPLTGRFKYVPMEIVCTKCYFRIIISDIVGFFCLSETKESPIKPNQNGIIKIRHTWLYFVKKKKQPNRIIYFYMDHRCHCFRQALPSRCGPQSYHRITISKWYSIYLGWIKRKRFVCMCSFFLAKTLCPGSTHI